MACLLCVHRFTRSLRGCFFVVVEDGALTVDTVVLRPRSQAEPAELMAAGEANHHVASRVLLDWALALWTMFCVRSHPLCILALCSLLLFPFLGLLAIYRLVRRLAALETELGAAVAHYVD